MHQENGRSNEQAVRKTSWSSASAPGSRFHSTSMPFDWMEPLPLAAPEVLEHLFQEQQAPITGSLAEALLDGLCCQTLIGCQDLWV